MAYQLIKTRSPFYVQYASLEPVVSLDLTVWSGTISSKPSVTYQLSKEPIGGSATFEIAELIRDFINHTSTSEGKVWAEVVVSDGVSATFTETYLATEGYGLFSEGLQHDGTISTVTGYALPEYGVRTYRVLLPENTAGSAPSLNYTSVNAGTDSTANQISYEAISNVDTQIQKTENALTYTITIDRFRCSKWDTAKLSYVNKIGALQDFYFTMKSKEMLSSQSDSFNRSLTDFTSFSANEGLHAHRKRILGSKQSFSLNTDYIDEYYVSQLEELFLSEYVWLSFDGGTAIPVNIDSSSLEKKTHLRDKLIQYEFNVTTAADYLNLVR